LVLGTDFSKQVYLKPGRCVLVCPRLFHRGCEANNDKGSTINLSQEIRTTDNLLSKLSNQQSQNIKNQYEAQIEAPIKTGDCVIM
jgi:hypothetical protein